jgi:hypothetical protein
VRALVGAHDTSIRRATSIVTATLTRCGVVTTWGQPCRPAPVLLACAGGEQHTPSSAAELDGPIHLA